MKVFISTNHTAKKNTCFSKLLNVNPPELKNVGQRPYGHEVQALRDGGLQNKGRSPRMTREKI